MSSQCNKGELCKPWQKLGLCFDEKKNWKHALGFPTGCNYLVVLNMVLRLSAGYGMSKDQVQSMN